MTETGDGRDKSIASLRGMLVRVVNGDPRAIPTIAAVSHDDLHRAVEAQPTRLRVSRAAAVTVLTGIRDGGSTPDEAQAWASFVRRGYVGGRTGPIRPLDIDYEEAWEDAIVEAVARLDEIGDMVDGQVPTSEVLALLQLLGTP